MEMETISTCLKFIDTRILSGIEKHAGSLEDLRGCITRKYKKIYQIEGYYVGYTISN